MKPYRLMYIFRYFQTNIFLIIIQNILILTLNYDFLDKSFAHSNNNKKCLYPDVVLFEIWVCFNKEHILMHK